ncbi:hypothetical protein GYH30_001632 [Glycine max]|nr:hypothetical protein GYH30_001632 [Glycine max]
MPCFKPLRYVGHLVGMARILLLNWAQLANQNQLVDHYASKHPKEKPPAESS